VTPYRPLWLAVLVLGVLSPIGLYLPERLQTGTAWGEWTGAELQRMLGYLPHGMQRLAELWTAPLPAYGWAGVGAAPFHVRGLAYLVSALLGIAACAAASYLLTRWLTRSSR
jgi:hypothetical protein